MDFIDKITKGVDYLLYMSIAYCVLACRFF